ncbi:MAG: DoxX family protein [Arcobacteraceae bacterium]
MRNIEDFLARALTDDLGKLILRFTIGFLMLFHGYDKLTNGIDGIKFLVTRDGLPEFLAYGVYVGEVVVPILIIIGLFTRISSIIYAATMLFAIYLAHAQDVFAISEKGAWAIELQALFMLGALALAFLGAGKYSIDKK